MFRTTLITMALLMLSASVYAAECPSYSDWLERQKPQKDQPQSWELSQHARTHGWRSVDSYGGSDFNTYKSNNKDITQIPPDVDLHVVIEYESGDTVYCIYRSGMQKIAVAVNAMHDVKRVSKKEIDTNANFTWLEGWVWPSYVCKTDARHPENCVWYWRHGEWNK